MATRRQRREPSRWADARDVAQVAEQWTDDQITCRDLGHVWQLMDAVHVARLKYFRVSHVCPRCEMVRIREMSESGHVYAQTYQYPDGYLVEGLGRIAGDAKDAIRVASIRRYAVTEVKGRAKDSDLPRFGATKRAIEG